MRQALGAFKAAPLIDLKGLAFAGLFLLAQGCAALTGKPAPDVAATQADELRVARATATDLQAGMARLAAENAKLESRVIELERTAARVAALEPPVIASDPVAIPSVLKEGPPPKNAPAIDNSPSTAPAHPVVAAPNADISLPRAPVPIDDSPRLVQPSFASTDQIFENEAASPEIKLTSVLWGVHLASYRHPDEANSGWQKLQRENPDELGLLEPRVEKVAIAGKGEYLRLIGGGFSSREKAKSLCDTLAAKGVFCRIANFGGDRLSMLDVGGLR